MARPSDPASLSMLARAGFTALGESSARLDELSERVGVDRAGLVAGLVAADPDEALVGVLHVARRDPVTLARIIRDDAARDALWRVFGVSSGLADFFHRHPEQLTVLAQSAERLPTEAELRQRFAGAVGAEEGFAASGDEEMRVRLRVAYRRALVEIVLFDVRQSEPLSVVDEVARTLADAAGAALEAALAIARARLLSSCTREEVALTRLAIIGMGKAGARELNYVSDVDVVFVAASAAPERLSEHRAIDVATRLARETMAAVSGLAVEPALWEVDAALRPEGKQGALVRSLESHLTYYDRWANSWEFQALLKSRPLAGDRVLGEEYVQAVQPRIWQSSSRENFVESVQRMRERVTEHVDAQDAPYQLKLGRGGLRDIEFTVQLLQLVHGLADPSIRTRGTLESLDALVAGGYVGRAEGAVFARDYRLLRLLEHRVQLRDLSRTHLMPRTSAEQRVLARSTRLAASAEGIWTLWNTVRREVRDIHTRLFYRPLLSAVAALPEDGRNLSADHARDRLSAIGFRDPAGALRHIAALTTGIGRKTVIQRHLMPVMVRWFADGADPDYALVAFRRISERLGDTHWYLRMLRDSSGAADRLARLLSSSRYIGELMEWIPESVAWLDRPEMLRPRGAAALDDEARAIQGRHARLEDAAEAVRALRRRELLRTAMGAVLDVVTIHEVGATLAAITEVAIQAALRAVRRELVGPADEALDFAVIGMGRLGGAEVGFGSDADILYVYEANGIPGDRAQRLAQAIVAALREHIADPRAPLELDGGLRPEGRGGPLVRSLAAYAEYYRRWSVSWESQALLRARGIAGSATLLGRFTALADTIRYPAEIDEQGVREIKRIKARVEAERLPRGADPRRHLKLGPGTLSDVEWLVQLIQLRHGHRIPQLQTPSTLAALQAAVDADLLAAEAGTRLREAWLLSSRLRSAVTLLRGQPGDLLPSDRRELDALGLLLGYDQNAATRVEEDFFAVTRRARRVFERLFYDAGGPGDAFVP